MNKIVSFELAKSLKEKGYKLLPEFESSYPTITDVVMWLYDKHGIWINVSYKRHSEDKHFAYTIRQANGIETYLWEHNSPTEAYESAILYCLKNLI